jgi:putative SOS response-associated peptidase YedK
MFVRYSHLAAAHRELGMLPRSGTTDMSVKGARPLFWFRVPSRPVFSFAGIWRETEGQAVFAFLSTDANSIVAPIHPKAVPLILHEGDEERWLRSELDDLVAPFPSQLMTVVQDPDPKRELTWSDGM